jgi:hypothetical protein
MASQEATARPKRSRTPRRNGDPHKPGRPHDLDRPIPQPDGTTIPAAEAIVRQMRTGLPIAQAAKAIGIDRATALGWRGDGATIRQRINDAVLTPDDLTRYQTAALAFFDAALQAEAHAEALYAARLSSAAAGGYVIERVVEEFDRSGNLLGKRVTRQNVPPDTKATTFWLQTRAPERWGRAQRIELGMADGPARVQTDSPLTQLAEALEAIERRKAEGAKLAAVPIEVTEASA